MKYDSWLQDGSLDPDFKEFLFHITMEILGGIAIIDKKHRMLFINDKYANSMDVNKTEALGKKIEDVVDNTDMLHVLETGLPDVGVVYERNKNSFIVNRFPIIKDNEIAGVIGISTFEDIIELKRLKRKINQIKGELDYYRDKWHSLVKSKYGIDNIVTRNKAMLNLKDLTRKIAMTRSTVLITGESGTGKELFAHSIHALSPRACRPFIRLNCAAIPETLLESELFGYEGGAFTGASKSGKVGAFELANGGTLLLDEIDALPINLQSKLLRAIQEKEIQKVGGLAPTEIDIRLIFTTNKDLIKLAERDEFREDLYYRINVINLVIPPLRERMEDIPPLVCYLIDKLNRELGMNIEGITPTAMAILKRHGWPGNIRELENCIERAFNYAIKGWLDVEHFENVKMRYDLNEQKQDSTGQVSLKSIREAAEKKAIVTALTHVNGNKKEAAKELKIDRSVLYDKIAKYDISLENGF